MLNTSQIIEKIIKIISEHKNKEKYKWNLEIRK